MKLKDLSKSDLELLNTDFGDYEKIAEEQVKVAGELYIAGEEMATAAADQMDKLAENEKEEEGEEEEEGDDGEKKASEDYGNIIAEGFIAKLAALGEERYGDPVHYFMPMVEEKVAAAGASMALGKFFKAVKGKAGNVGKYLKTQSKSVGKDLKSAVTGKNARGGELSAKERLIRGARGGGKALGAAGVVGGAGYLGSKAMGKD